MRAQHQIRMVAVAMSMTIVKVLAEAVRLYALAVLKW
jgi:hypothetical protein